MKVKDLHEMDNAALNAKLKELERELNAELSSKAAAGGRARNPGKIRTLKKTIARIKTILNQRAKGIIR